MKILLIEDHQVVRFGLRTLLEGIAGGATILEAAAFQRGAALYEEQRDGIDLVVLDLNLPDARGLAGLRRFVRRYPDARVVVLSGSVDEAIASEAISIGALAFLHKASEIEGLRDDLAALIEGTRGGLASPAPAAGQRAASTAESRGVCLRELDVRILDLLLQGHTNREIAEAIGIAVGTVKNHVSGLLAAFGVGSRARLITLFH